MLQNTNKKGFTLIELLIVVVIIGILAAIAIPKFSSTKEKAYMASMKADLKNLVNAQEAFYADSGHYANGGTTGFSYTTSQGNVMAATDIVGDATGWSAKVTNPAVTSVTSCNIFAGGPTGAAATNKGSATQDGAPACQ
jgi:prepilin-type N-terminal cleavage/methylation domain-containing protein